MNTLSQSSEDEQCFVNVKHASSWKHIFNHQSPNASTLHNFSKLVKWHIYITLLDYRTNQYLLENHEPCMFYTLYISKWGSLYNYFTGPFSYIVELLRASIYHHHSFFVYMYTYIYILSYLTKINWIVVDQNTEMPWQMSHALKYGWLGGELEFKKSIVFFSIKSSVFLRNPHAIKNIKGHQNTTIMRKSLYRD